MEENKVNQRTYRWMKAQGWDYVQGVMKLSNADQKKGGDFRIYLTNNQWVGIDHFGRRYYSSDPNDVILIEDMGDCSSSSMLEHFYRLCHAGEIMLAQLVLAMGAHDWEKFQPLLSRLQNVNPLIAQRIQFLIHVPNGEPFLKPFDKTMQQVTSRVGSSQISSTQNVSCRIGSNQNKKGGEKQCRENVKPHATGKPTRSSKQSVLSDFP